MGINGDPTTKTKKQTWHGLQSLALEPGSQCSNPEQDELLQRLGLELGAGFYGSWLNYGLGANCHTNRTARLAATAGMGRDSSGLILPGTYGTTSAQQQSPLTQAFHQRREDYTACPTPTS